MFKDFIIKNPSLDSRLTEFGKATLVDRYLLPGEDFQGMFARVAGYYADDKEHAQRLYDYISKHWFMPATPILSNGGTKRGLPISCFLNSVDDSLESIIENWTENVWLASKGGGIGSYWGNLRSLGEVVGKQGAGKTSGIIPFIKVQDSLTLAISQGSLRRGSAAVYLDVWHPEIEEFVELRRASGGDPNRKTLNLHHGINIDDKFMFAVRDNASYDLLSPKDKSVVRSINARDLWIRILNARLETGEPYLLFVDHVNKAIPEHHKKLGLTVKQSNLCSEITLPTGKDHLGNERTAVCCLSSLNLDYYDEWNKDDKFIEDVIRFLDNVLQDFIDNAPDSMAKAKYSAMRERSIGLGVMGFHSFLQSKMIAFEGAMTKVWNKRIFKHIKTKADEASFMLAMEKGPCPDAAEFNIMERFSNKIAIAPTASISIIAGTTSPGIEPWNANIYTQKTLSGSFSVKNPHLEKLLESRQQNTQETWSKILRNQGSVQDLNCLTDEEKEVFKTAQETNPYWTIENCGDRVEYVCQAQSINLFLPANISKLDLHRIHYLAWEAGIKSLYYCRSTSIQRAESISKQISYEECLACQ